MEWHIFGVSDQPAIIVSPTRGEPSLVLALVSGQAERDLLESLVLTLGHSLAWCGDAGQLVRMVEMVRPAVLVIDFKDLLPKGAQILRKVLIARPSLPTLVFVEDVARQEALEAHRTGVFAVMRKPLHEDELQFHIGHALTTSAEQYDPMKVRHEERHLVLRNDFSMITPVAKSLVDTTLSPSDSRRTQVILGLIEILSNAIEHGNLGIDYHEKRDALRGSYFFDLAQERCGLQPWCERVVRITSEVLPDEGVIRYTIADEGDGFDWRATPDPTNPENMIARHGRGLLMARHSFDRTAFNDKGNVVVLELALAPSPTTESQ